MPPYRSTTLRYAADFCPHALDHYEARTPHDRTIFQPGIASHACLEAIGAAISSGRPHTPEQIADQVVRELVTGGRSFDGTPEPPMSVDHATKGRDLALGYLARNDLSPTARQEVGLAVDSDWRPVRYSRDAYYVAALDVLDTYEDEEENTIVETADYKGAWPTDSTSLDTTQIRGQLAIAVAHHPNASIGRRSVINLRTAQRHSSDVVLDDAGMVLIQQWQRDIGHQIAAAEKRGPDGRRPASPGVQCMGCPYVLRCSAARDMWGPVLSDGREGLAQTYAVARAMSDALLVLVKAACADASIDVEGGTVGYVATEERGTVTGVEARIAHEWFAVAADKAQEWDADNARLLGLLGAMGVGVGQVGAVATRLHPGRGPGKKDGWKEARAALIDGLTEPKTVRRFGIWKASTTEEEQEEE
jgi:hypothetical protein